MNFTEDTRLNCMVANTTFKGHKIKIRLTLEENNILESVAKESIHEVEENWTKIETAITTELYGLFIREWAEDDEKDYSKEEFFEKIIPTTIDFDDYEDEETEQTYTMYFKDSSLFGNHGIQVFWGKGNIKKIDVSLVG
jgi:hypothetical protein